MGWLFGKKKVPKVPFPEGHVVEDDGTLRFPDSPMEKIIEPGKLKMAAGMKEEVEMPEKIKVEAASEMPNVEVMQRTLARTDPLYIKMDIYQHILGEIEFLRDNLEELNSANRGLQNSEFNEEANFEKLRKNVKVIHDRLLQADKTLFKT